ncbi:hypothetical protein JW977_03535 [Candidatus Falkowbacteria bacterium]|nr:hypothetical protein [Candidatus Falkowbacteria bacterium]
MKKGMKIGMILGLLALILLPELVAAQTTLDVGLSYVTSTGLPTGDIRTTIATIINVAMGLLGVVAVVIILVGGFKWMTAMGNEENVKTAKKLIFQGVIGLVIILSAYAIANFVLTNIINATSQQ